MLRRISHDHRRSNLGLLRVDCHEQAVALPAYQQHGQFILLDLVRSLQILINRLDGLVIDLLNDVGLDEMLLRAGGLDTFLDWQNVLSTGEQQLVTLARVVLAKPKFLFMDESTTALDRKTEELMMEKKKKITQAYISIGYHDTLAPFHHTTLRLLGEGKWQLEMNK